MIIFYDKNVGKKNIKKIFFMLIWCPTCFNKWHFQKEKDCRIQKLSFFLFEKQNFKNLCFCFLEEQNEAKSWWYFKFNFYYYYYYFSWCSHFYLGSVLVVLSDYLFCCRYEELHLKTNHLDIHSVKTVKSLLRLADFIERKSRSVTHFLKRKLKLMLFGSDTCAIILSHDLLLSIIWCP